MALLPASLRHRLLPAALILAAPAFAVTEVTLVNGTRDHWTLIPEPVGAPGRFHLMATLLRSEHDCPDAQAWPKFFLKHDENGPLQLHRKVGTGHPLKRVKEIALPPGSSLQLHTHCFPGMDLRVKFRLRCAADHLRKISGSGMLVNLMREPHPGLTPTDLLELIMRQEVLELSNGQGGLGPALTLDEVGAFMRDSRKAALYGEFENVLDEPRFTFTRTPSGALRLEEEGAAAGTDGPFGAWDTVVQGPSARSFTYPGEYKAEG